MDTPYYVFSKEKIINNFYQMSKNLYLCDIYYALKANSEIEILEILNNCNAGFEIASLGELDKLEKLNINSDRIICSLPVKSIELITQLYLYGCRYFVFDTIDELIKLCQYAPNSKKILRLYIGDILDNSIGYGMRIECIKSLVDNNSSYLDIIDGVTFYVSKNKNISNLIRVFDRVDYILSLLSWENKILNIGGNYRLLDEVPAEFYVQLNNRLTILAKKYNLRILAEPGHGIIKNAGTLITKVVLTKKQDNEVHVFIDAGTPTGIHFEPDEVRKIENTSELAEEILYKFYGITCSHQLLFVKKLNYNIMQNDILEFSNYGSYTICMSNNFHSWSKPIVKIQ